jgi:hypothetical protein
MSVGASHRTVDVLDFYQEELVDLSVRALSGALIDTSADCWRISADHVLNWSNVKHIHPGALNALKGYARYLIRNNAPAYVASQLKHLRVLGRNQVELSLRRSMVLDYFINRSVFETFKQVALETVSLSSLPSYTGAFVRWYLWSTDAGYSAFDPEVAAEFELIHVGGNPQGQAVLRQDPNSGPLREVEMTALRAALKAAERNETLSISDLCLAWLFLSFGTNPKNIRLMNEDDLIKTPLRDGGMVYELRIPRIKKRTAGERDQFRVRRLVPAVGHLIDRLIAENQAHSEISSERERPLFHNPRPRSSLVGTAFDSQSHRRPVSWATERMSEIGRTLNLKCFDGKALRLSPRRLRYSFATRLVQEGASIQEVADALDHSSTEHVHVYFNARSDLVRRLDQKLALVLAPIAQAFMGTLIRGEQEAIRGNDPRSRIRHYSGTREALEPVGSCGSFGFCGLLAPVACYTCNHFQAWLGAPHEAVLQDLEQRREHKLEEGADPRWVQLYDETILAVALVILRCGEMHATESRQ